MLDELSQDFTKKTGRPRDGSFSIVDIEAPRSVFLLAYDDAGRPLGCGALRPVAEISTSCEVKRMYSRNKSSGLGSKILHALEQYAVKFGYKNIWIATGTENHRAVSFYLRHGYIVRENYGNYRGHADCVCLEKAITEK